MKYSLQRLFVVVAIIAAILGVGRMFYLELTRVEFGENVPSVSWLPKSATNVSYYRSHSFTAYEYEIPEDDFLKSSQWKLSDIGSTVTIERYCFLKSKMPDFGPMPTAQEQQAIVDAFNAHWADVDNGWFYSHRQRNGGGVVSVYDRKLGKAYFWSAPR